MNLCCGYEKKFLIVGLDMEINVTLTLKVFILILSSYSLQHSLPAIK